MRRVLSEHHRRWTDGHRHIQPGWLREQHPVPQPDVQDPFVQNPFVQNPFVRNYGAENPFVQNSGYTNYSVSNPFVRNPFVRNTALGDDYEVHGVVDTTWEVTPDNAFNPDVTNTASSYVPIINIDNADKYKGNYAFQLLVHTTSYSTGYRQAEDELGNKLFDENGQPICEAYNIPHEQILSNVVQDPDAENPFVRNPFVLNPFVRNSAENPFVQNPFVQNPFVQNSAFAMAPPEGPTETEPAASPRSPHTPTARPKRTERRTRSSSPCAHSSSSRSVIRDNEPPIATDCIDQGCGPHLRPEDRPAERSGRLVAVHHEGVPRGRPRSGRVLQRCRSGPGSDAGRRGSPT